MFGTIIRKTVLLLLLFSTNAAIVNSQDTHYNTVQYGARSALMGGAVIGNVKDNTAVFYNPAGLGFIDTSNISTNGNAYQLDNIRIYNAIGAKKDFKSSQLGSVPLFVGGMISKQNKKLKIGYSVMNAVSFGFKATARIDDNVQVVDDAESPGKEAFIGQSGIDAKLSELVFGIGGGYKLSDHWSVGFTNLVYVRSQNFTRVTYSRMFLNNSSNDMVSASFSRTADYFNVRYQAKLGINYRADNFSAGITFNTPSLRIMGSGTIAADVIGSNVLFNGKRTDLLANDRQEKIKSTYKSPIAVAGGANYSIGKSAFGIALQYFGSTGMYDVMQAEPSAFVRPAALYSNLGSDQFLRLKAAAKSVFNVALGYEYTVRPGLTFSGSVRSNQSYFDNALNNSVGIKSDVTSWDIYHVTAGSSFTMGRSKITLGFLYSRGTDKSRQQQGNLENPNEGNLLQGGTTITKATYSSIGLLLGYSFGFKK